MTARVCEIFQEEVHLGSALLIHSAHRGAVDSSADRGLLFDSGQIAIDGLRFEAVIEENFILSVVGEGVVGGSSAWRRFSRKKDVFVVLVCWRVSSRGIF